MRAALGAVPARIARELLVESLVLGAAGSVLGLVLAYVGLQVLVAIGPSNLPRLQEIAVYPPVLAFTVAVSLASTLVFGSITALKHALHVDTPMTGAARGVEREPRAQRDAQRFGRRAGGARARVGRERGAHDPNVSSAARRRPRFFGPGDDSNGADLDSDRPGFRPRAIHPHAARDARQDRGASGRRVGRLCERASDGRSRPISAPIVVEGQTLAPGDTAAVAQMQVRLARVLRSHGHANHCGTRRDLERHRSGRPRGRDLRGLRSRARGRARRRARQTHPDLRRRRTHGAR